jgi:hypothetical protein
MAFPSRQQLLLVSNSAGTHLPVSGDTDGVSSALKLQERLPPGASSLGWDTRCMRALLQHQLILLKVTCESLAVAIVVSNSFHAGLGTGPRTMWGWKVRWKPSRRSKPQQPVWRTGKVLVNRDTLTSHAVPEDGAIPAVSGLGLARCSISTPVRFKMVGIYMNKQHSPWQVQHKSCTHHLQHNTPRLAAS